MILFSCPGCQDPLNVEDDFAGKSATCPRCKESVPVPAASSTATIADRATLAPQTVNDAGSAPRSAPAAPIEATVEGSSAATGGDDDDEVSFAFLAPAQAPDELGRLGPYRVLRLLGAGGMGMVLEAEDSGLMRKVALKVMRPELAATAVNRQRFQREAQAAADIEHPNVVVIYQIGEDRGVPFIAMPFLRGEPLDSRLKRERRLSVADVARIGRQMADGLGAAHERGLVHRDVKPANVWLEAKTGLVKILDFGLARSLEGGRPNLTQSGMIVGTPSYMAPEQARGEPMDHRGDLFSLGTVLYQMATGEMPFKGADMVSTLVAVASSNPRPVRVLNPAIPQVLADLVTSLLAKEPDQRPANARDVSDVLAALEREAVVAAGGSLAPMVPASEPTISLAPPIPAAGATVAQTPPVPAAGATVSLKPPAPASGATTSQPPSTAAAATSVSPPLPGAPATPPPSPAGGRRLLRTGIVVASLAALVALGVIWMRGSTGQLELVAEGTVASVKVQKNGTTVATLDSKDNPRTSLPPGEYKLVLAAGEGVQLVDDRVVLRGGDRQVVTVRRRPETLRPPARFTLDKHRGPVRCLAYSPDGEVLVSGSDDKTVKVWKTRDGSQIVSLDQHTAPVLAVAFAPNGKVFVSGGEDGKIAFWNAETYKLIQLVDAQSATVRGLAFTNDSSQLIDAGTRSGSHLWSVETGKPVGGRSFSGGSISAPSGWSVTQPREGHYWWPVGLDNGTIQVWSWSNAGLQPVLEGHTGAVRGLATTRKGEVLASGGADYDVKIWDLPGAPPRKTLRGHRGAVFGLAFSPDDAVLASASQDASLRLWDVKTGHLKSVFSAHDGSVNAVAFAPTGNFLATCGDDNLVRLWDVSTLPEATGDKP